MEIPSHVYKRVKHQPEIGLPLSELWSIYSGAHSAPMVRNFCILYIEMAMDRADRKVFILSPLCLGMFLLYSLLGFELNRMICVVFVL